MGVGDTIKRIIGSRSELEPMGMDHGEDWPIGFYAILCGGDRSLGLVTVCVMVCGLKFRDSHKEIQTLGILVLGLRSS